MMISSRERFGFAALLTALGVCCGTALLAAAVGAGVLAGLGSWIVGGGWLAVPIALVAAIGTHRLFGRLVGWRRKRSAGVRRSES